MINRRCRSLSLFSLLLCARAAETSAQKILSVRDVNATAGSTIKVSVELNDAIVHRDQFAATQLKEGDRLEFIYYMGGGVEKSKAYRDCPPNTSLNRMQVGLSLTSVSSGWWVYGKEE